MDDGPWTRTELRERAAFVLGVTPDASTTEAWAQYRTQLVVHGGVDERSRTARRTLAAAWALWNETVPAPWSLDRRDPTPDPGGRRPERADLLERARVSRDRRLSEGAAVIAGDTVESFDEDDVEALLGGVEVVEVVRDRIPHWRTGHPVAPGRTGATARHAYDRTASAEVIVLGETDVLV